MGPEHRQACSSASVWFAESIALTDKEHFDFGDAVVRTEDAHDKVVVGSKRGRERKGCPLPLRRRTVAKDRLSNRKGDETETLAVVSTVLERNRNKNAAAASGSASSSNSKSKSNSSSSNTMNEDPSRNKNQHQHQGIRGGYTQHLGDYFYGCVRRDDQHQRHAHD